MRQRAGTFPDAQWSLRRADDASEAAAARYKTRMFRSACTVMLDLASGPLVARNLLPAAAVVRKKTTATQSRWQRVKIKVRRLSRAIKVELERLAEKKSFGIGQCGARLRVRVASPSWKPRPLRLPDACVRYEVIPARANAVLTSTAE